MKQAIVRAVPDLLLGNPPERDFAGFVKQLWPEQDFTMYQYILNFKFKYILHSLTT